MGAAERHPTSRPLPWPGRAGSTRPHARTSTRPHATGIRRAWLGFALLAATLGAGCEEDVAVNLGTEQPFTLYGVLSPQMDTQFVRVYPIEPLLLPREPVPLDARLVSVDRQTGEEVVWTDSLIQDGGLWEHVFWAPFEAAYGHRYELTITDADGRATTAAAAVPIRTEIEIGEAASGPNVTVPVRLPGDVPRLLHVEAGYRVRYTCGGGPGSDGVERLWLPYDDRPAKRADGWRFALTLEDDYNRLREALQERRLWDPGHGIVPIDIRLRLAVVSEDWAPPGGVFDPDVLIQPGTFSNVVNGFGFVGAGYRLERGFVLADDVIEQTRFRVGECAEGS